MKCIFRDKRVLYSIWVKIFIRFLTRHATRLGRHQKHYPNSYLYEHFVFIIQIFFGTSRGVINDDEEVLEAESDPMKHMESSVGEN